MRKDIEEEIKSTEIDDSTVRSFAARTIYHDIIRDSKFRYSENDQDYAFTRLIDDHQEGQEQNSESYYHPFQWFIWQSNYSS